MWQPLKGLLMPASLACTVKVFYLYEKKKKYSCPVCSTLSSSEKNWGPIVLYSNIPFQCFKKGMCNGLIYIIQYTSSVCHEKIKGTVHLSCMLQHTSVRVNGGSLCFALDWHNQHQTQQARSTSCMVCMTSTYLTKKTHPGWITPHTHG